MSKSPLLAGAALAALALVPLSAQADDLLSVDLSVPNTVTLNALPGLSAATLTGSNFTGIYLQNFYNAGPTGLLISGGTGNFTSAANTPDNSPGIFHLAGDSGLNFYTWTAETASFTAGSTAFTGTGTWTVSPVQYAELLAGNTSGTVVFPADRASNAVNATVLGTYVVSSVPEPATAGLLAFAGFGLLARRRR